MSPEIVGYVAAGISVAAFTPQAWKVIKTRDTKDIVTLMWVAETVAFALWVLYGALLAKWPIIVPNTLCFLLAGFILMMKLLPHRAKHAVADKLDPAK